MKTILTVMGVVIGLSLGASASAADFSKQLGARQAQMKLYGFHMGILGGMAKGAVSYDAATASAAAGNMLALSQMNTGAMWPQGSGNDNDELWDKTRAKPEIWTTYPMIAEKGKGLTTALTKMAADAGNGLDALRGAMGGVGGACKGCHQDFRAEKN